MRQRTFGFHKMLCISQPAKDLSASQEQFCSLQLVT